MLLLASLNSKGNCTAFAVIKTYGDWRRQQCFIVAMNGDLGGSPADVLQVCMEITRGGAD